MPISMDVEVGQGNRRLPIYLLLDASGSMSGAPIEAVNRGIEIFKQEVMADPFASETVHVGIIVFSSSAQMITNGLVPIENLDIPTLEAGGLTALGSAFRVLKDSLKKDIRKSVPGEKKGDWKPLVFILTDGMPTDDWEQAREEIIQQKEKKLVNLITVGCGPDIDEENLKKISVGPTFRMDNSENSFKAFFEWVSQSVASVSESLNKSGNSEENALSMPPPPSSTIQVVF